MARRHGLLGLAALGFLLGALTFPLAHALSISESIHGTPPSVTRMHGVLTLKVHAPTASS